jgi:hypothetical protein
MNYSKDTVPLVYIFVKYYPDALDAGIDLQFTGLHGVAITSMFWKMMSGIIRIIPILWYALWIL